LSAAPLRPLAVLLALAAAACTPGIVLGKRYRSSEWTWQESGAPAFVSLSIQAHPVADEPPPTLLESVTPAAQNTLIDRLGARIEDPLELLALLSEPGPDGTADLIDHTTFRRTLVFSVQKSLLERSADGRPLVRPADRLSRLEITLDLEHGEFRGWSGYDTAYGTADLGSVQLDQQRNAAVGALGSSPTLPLQEARGGASTGLSESAYLTRQYEALTPILEPGRVTLFREGIAGIDLSGSLALEVELRWAGLSQDTEVIRIDNLRRGGRPTEPDRLHVRRAALVYADGQGLDAIRGRGVARYELRSVRSGDQTLSEHDDAVEFIVGERQASSVLVERAELEVDKYAIRCTGFLRLKDFGPLEFASYEDARGFLDWMLETDWTGRELRVGPYALEDTSADRLLTADDVTRLRIEAIALNH